MDKRYVGIVVASILIIIATIGYNIYNKKLTEKKVIESNHYYESLYDVNITGTSLATVINKTLDKNNKDNIESYGNKQIDCKIKFLYSDKDIDAKNIEKHGMDKFLNAYSNAVFKLSNIEYDSKTKRIKSIFFEELN